MNEWELEKMNATSIVVGWFMVFVIPTLSLGGLSYSYFKFK